MAHRPMTKAETLRHTVAAPAKTHRRVATCAEIECAGYVNGMVSVVPVGSPQANYYDNVMNQGERPGDPNGFYRHYTKKVIGDALVEYTFPAGQRCFTEHTIPTGRPALFFKRNGLADPIELTDTNWKESLQESIYRASTVIQGG